jgi:hypothetical protein
MFKNNNRRNTNTNNKKQFREDPDCAVFMSGFRTDIKEEHAREYREVIYQAINKNYDVYIRKLDLPVNSKVGYLHVKTRAQAQKLLNLRGEWDEDKQRNTPVMYLADDPIKVYTYKSRRDGNNNNNNSYNTLNLNSKNNSYENRRNNISYQRQQQDDNRSISSYGASSRNTSQEPSRCNTPSMFNNHRSRTISKTSNDGNWRKDITHNPMNIQDDNMSLKMNDNIPMVLDSALTTYDVSANESEYVDDNDNDNDNNNDIDNTLTKSSTTNNHNNMDWATGVTRQNTIKESTVSSCSTEVQKVINQDQNKIEINEIKTETSESIDIPFLTQQSVVTVVDKEENSINTMNICEQDQQSQSNLMMIPQEIINTNTSSVDQSTSSDSTTSGVNTNSSGQGCGQSSQINDTMSEDYNTIVKNSMFEMAAQTLQQIWPKEFDSWPIEQAQIFISCFFQVYLTDGPDAAIFMVNGIVEEGERIRSEREQAISNLMALISPSGYNDSGSHSNFIGQFAKSF